MKDKGFEDWCNEQIQNPDFWNSFADYTVFMLPEPRYKYYESNSFDKIKSSVLDQVDKLITALGVYPL